MRQYALECKDEEKINRFLTSSKTGYLGMSDNGAPYVIPLNYVWWNGVIYFHGAAEGRKIDILSRNPQVCFTVSEEFGTMADPIPAMTDTAFMSVIIFGEAQPVTELSEATGAMQVMLDKYVPGYYHTALSGVHVERYRSSLGSKTLVFALTPLNLTAKENKLDRTKTYYKGRTSKMDAK